MKLVSKLALLFVFAFVSVSAVRAGNFDGSATSGLWSKQQKLESQQGRLLQQQQYLEQQQRRQKKNVRLPFRTYPNNQPSVETVVNPKAPPSRAAKKAVANKASARAKAATSATAKSKSSH